MNQDICGNHSKNLKKEYEEKRDILVNHWQEIEKKNEKYMNHVKGDCLCSICKCGKCKCRVQRIQIDSKVDMQSNYMRSYNPLSQRYNEGNRDIKETIDQTKTVLWLNQMAPQIISSSRSLESRSIKSKIDESQSSSLNSYASKQMINYSPRHLKYGEDMPFYLKIAKSSGFKEYTEEEIHELCQKTNFQRNVEEIIKNNQNLNKNPDAWKVPNLRVPLAPIAGDSTYRKQFIDKQTKVDEPIIQLQELPPNVRSVPYNINTQTRQITDRMLNELSQLKNNISNERSHIRSLKDINEQNFKQNQNRSMKLLVSQSSHRSQSPISIERSGKSDKGSANSNRTKDDIQKTFQRKNDITQQDFINYSQQCDQIQKTVFSCYDKFINEASAYKHYHCNLDQQQKAITASNDEQLNYNQIDKMINQNVQKINKVGYFQQTPSFQGQFITSNQSKFSPEPRMLEYCPSQKAKSSQSPRQDCKQNEQDLIPRKYYNHRYNRVIRFNGKKEHSVENKTVIVPIDPQKADIPAFINQLQQQQMQEKLKKK